MKQHLLTGIRLTAVSLLVFAGLYTLLIFGLAQLAPAKGEGETLRAGGRTVGYALEGQSFTQDKYFQGRPSAVGYNAAGSGGSNKGPTNPDYLKDVAARIDTFVAHNPGVSRADIPSELVTASGGGLDPDISPAAASIQIGRIAKLRGLPAASLDDLVKKHTEKPLAGLMGTERVNVLSLNLDLDQLR